MTARPAPHPDRGYGGSRFLSGARTVAAQELRIRLRAGKWRRTLGIWFAVLAAFLLVLRVALSARRDGAPFVGPGASLSATNSDALLGPPMFGGLVLVVLALGLLLVPALAGQSVNGDRERGTLALLQVTLLRPAEIAVGKFLAAWGAALAFLAVTLPLVGWCMAEGGVPVNRVLATYGVLAAVLAAVTALSLALSTLVTRSTMSALLSYLTVFALTVGTVIAFGLLLATVGKTQDQQPGWRAPTGMTVDVLDTRRVWWALAPNPFVVAADAAPTQRYVASGVAQVEIGPVDPAVEVVYDTEPYDPLSALGNQVGKLRLSAQERDDPSSTARGAPVWPWGLAFYAVVTGGCLGITTRRLRTPVRRLARGQRIA